MSDRAVAPSNLDVLVVGSGVAGLSAAVRLAARPGVRVGVLTKGALEQSTTRFAQGGVAAAVSGDEDSTDLHLADTLRAGAGLCDRHAVRVLVDEGPHRVQELIALGAVFDRAPSGRLALAREGGHSAARVVHAGGAATGAEVERTLVEAVEATAAAILEGWFALDLIVEGGRCRGVSALAPDGTVAQVRAEHVLLAAGGGGQMYAVTTNPPEATGDGVAMAMRAGVAVADVEFVQFHPTALHHPAMPRPLLSEALRGHGALIRDRTGHRFVDELEPRDVVSRAMAAKMLEEGTDHVWLDATVLEDFANRFPTIAASLADAGLDPSTDLLPVAPAAHHLSGGILTDLSGASSLPGLWAAGEVACSGVHGANRLASNSLLEGMVFAARVVDAIEAGRSVDATGVLSGIGEPQAPGSIPLRQLRSEALAADLRIMSAVVSSLSSPSAPPHTGSGSADPVKSREVLQRAMTSGAGVTRTAASLAAARDTVAKLMHEASQPDRGTATTSSVAEMANLLTVSLAVLDPAAERQESRGAHFRADFPSTEDGFRCRLVIGDTDAAGVGTR